MPLQEEQAKLQKELKKWEVKRLDLQKGLESENKSSEQLKVETKKEKENHEKWHVEQERTKLSAWFDA